MRGSRFKSNQEQIVDTLIKAKADVNLLGQSKYLGLTPLGLAMRIFPNPNATEVIKALLKGKANPNTSDGNYNYVLYKAVVHENLEIAKALLEAGAGVNNQENDGFRFIEKETALFAAVRKGNVEMVKLLLDYQADPQVKNFLYQTPLQLAYVLMNDPSKEEIHMNMEKIIRSLKNMSLSFREFKLATSNFDYRS